jgi:outer membrane protein OmpA-like peptidoglycan-associated protein
MIEGHTDSDGSNAKSNLSEQSCRNLVEKVVKIRMVVWEVTNSWGKAEK